MKISAKQKQAIDLAFNPQVTELLWGGAGGAGKSYMACQIAVVFSKLYPGVRIFVGRKTLKSLKQSTIATLINKVHPDMGVKRDEYALHFSDMTLDYTNGSKLIFGELDYQPSDEDFARWGSLEVDFGIIEEAGEVVEKAFSVVKSRTGRGILASEYDMPGFIIATANPAQNFLKTRFYDPYEKLGGGDYQQWEIGDIEIGGKKVPSYRAFLRATAQDNPFLPQSYIDNLKTLPERERRRILDGDWNYADDDSMLFKSGLLDKATTYDLPSGEFDSFIGCDISDVGKDKSVFTLIKNGVVVTQKTSSVQMNWEKTSSKPLGLLLADELIEFAQRNGFTQKDSKRIAIETNGVGASCRDALRLRGWSITEYIATHKSRSENYYQLMLDFDSGALKIYHELTGLDNLRKELAAHTYEMREQIPDVCKKDKIKLAIGHSPDFADSLCIANYCRNLAQNHNGDIRYNTRRLIY